MKVFLKQGELHLDVPRYFLNPLEHKDSTQPDEATATRH
jgi:hypothetical protein